MKFVAAKIKEASEIGKDKALSLVIPFDEVEMLSQPQVQRFIFDNCPSFETLKVLPASVEADAGAKNAKESAEPGKPSAYYF